MSVAEETLHEKVITVAESDKQPMFNRALDFISSVRFGVTLLCLMVLLAFLGMIIVQQNVNGFDAFYVSLTPAEKSVYGALGFFDIYHSWYFNLLLLILSLNIVLASIDRFPSAWTYISTPKLDASRKWLLGQKQNAVIAAHADNEIALAEKVGNVFRANRLKTNILQKKGKFYVFGESGRWNRLGAYIVHVALLTLFLGHFVALQTGFDADVRLQPGQTTDDIQLIRYNLDKQERFNVALPFTIHCTDIQQTLIDPNGSIETLNTVNWRTQIKIDDPQYGETVADVSVNNPFSYRGYRFFQATAIAAGNARTVNLELTPQNGGQPINVQVPRAGSTDLPDGTKIEYVEFFPDFVLANGQADTRSGNYNNPAVKLNIVTPDGDKKPAYAFGKKLPDNVPIGAPVAGYKLRLIDFEKSPLAHVLSIKYDPFNAAFVAWYIGGFGLVLALCFVFFVAHKRFWAIIEPTDETNFEIVLGGNSNRNQLSLESKFNKIVEDLQPTAEI